MSVDLSGKLNIASELFRDEASPLIEKGVAYYDDSVFDIAVSSIRRVVPEIATMAHSRVGLECGFAVSVDTTDQSTRSFRGVAVEGILNGVILQVMHEEADFDGVLLDREVLDLCAVVLPRYTDPDPVDIVLRNELYVPLSGIHALERTAE